MRVDGKGEIGWLPEWIILDAKALQEAARHFEPQQDDKVDTRVNLSGDLVIVYGWSSWLWPPRSA